jgi:hypothetical protein
MEVYLWFEEDQETVRVAKLPEPPNAPHVTLAESNGALDGVLVIERVDDGDMQFWIMEQTDSFKKAVLRAIEKKEKNGNK